MLIGQVCQRASGIVVGSIPVMIRDEQVLITRDLRVQGKHWVSGDIRLPRAQQRFGPQRCEKSL